MRWRKKHQCSFGGTKEKILEISHYVMSFMFSVIMGVNEYVYILVRLP